MKKRVLAVAVLTILVLSVFAAPTLASIRNYTAVGFRYIGDVFHEKEVNVPVGSTYFLVTGKGEVGGTQVVLDNVDIDGTNVYIENYFFGTTALDAAANEHVRIISDIELDQALLQTGVEMDPGESGYIRQSAGYSVGSDGSYLKTRNYFGNTGGITRRIHEVGRYMQDRMEVIGYAEVWEITEVTSGNGKGGFWKGN